LENNNVTNNPFAKLMAIALTKEGAKNESNKNRNSYPIFCEFPRYSTSKRSDPAFSFGLKISEGDYDQSLVNHPLYYPSRLIDSKESKFGKYGR
jgi:hypothetical protein